MEETMPEWVAPDARHPGLKSRATDERPIRD
jgi:hypothetical protein